jgi:hypothetical protein
MNDSNRSYGIFNNLENFITALREFSSKKDEHGNGLSYSIFIKETGVTRKNIEYYTQKYNIKKVPARKKEMPNLGKFKTYDELVDAVIQFSNTKGQNGQPIPYSVFAETYEVDASIVYGIAARKCARRYNK